MKHQHAAQRRSNTSAPTRVTRRAFTLIELLIVVAIIALLIGVLLPALSSARRTAQAVACGSNLKQLGAAMRMYLDDHNGTLPQLRVNPATGELTKGSEGVNVGALFGGKLGTLPFLGIDQIGAERRPLNEYISDAAPPSDTAPTAANFEMPAFQSPADAGTTQAGLDAFDTSSVYNLIGTSYTLNDHALDDNPAEELYPTLIPREGGRPPRVDTPTRTWLLADQPIYNYDDGGDRKQFWYRNNRIVSNMLFYDLHVKLQVDVPEGQEQTTSQYTFLPSARWLEQFGVFEPE